MSAYITGNIAVDRSYIEGEGRTSEKYELDSAQSHGVLPRAVARSAAMCTGIQRDVSSPAVCRCIVVLPAVCSLVHVQLGLWLRLECSLDCLSAPTYRYIAPRMIHI